MTPIRSRIPVRIAQRRRSGVPTPIAAGVLVPSLFFLISPIRVAHAQSGGPATSTRAASNAVGATQEGTNVGFQPGEAVSTLSIPPNRLLWHVPEPEVCYERGPEVAKRISQPGDKSFASYVSRVLQRLDSIRRPNQLHLTLEESIRRALASNYAIEVERYNPAIEATRIVEAEAAFDAVFFSNLQKNHVDQSSASQLQATQFDTFLLSSGVRKLLPSGMSVSGGYDTSRTQTTLQFQGINPEYNGNFVLELRQPFLRGFGIDYNRSLIRITRNNREISGYEFEVRVRDLVRQVEELYWRLVQARREVVISSRLLADFEQIYEYLDARKDFDVIPVQLNATRANLEQSRAEFLRSVADVFDAEDRLAAAMDSEDTNLADDTELIPDNLPQLTRIVVDRLAEAQAALEHRPELKQSELQIANARLNLDRAKNSELPRFDVAYRQTINGLGRNFDQAFDIATQNDFVSHFVGIEFEMPIGNRGPRAATRRAALQHASAQALLKQRTEEVILDVNLAVRKLTTNYDQIAAAFEAAEAREREVESIVARAERKDINTLNSELNARQGLAAARRALIGLMVEYNIAIVDLERAKGTLLTYNNISVKSAQD